MLQGLSKYFGDHDLLVYVKHFIPEILKASTPAAYLGIATYIRSMHVDRQQLPEMGYMVGFYILFFSLIGHKEARFMLPIAPYMFLFAGYFLATFTRKMPRLVCAVIWGSTFFEITNFLVRLNFHDKYWDAMDYIVNFGNNPPHSVYTMHRFETPYYSWLHQKGQGYDE